MRQRVPTIDALIAATAAKHKLIRAHRDAHLRAIPAAMLRRADHF